MEATPEELNRQRRQRLALGIARAAGGAVMALTAAYAGRLLGFDAVAPLDWLCKTPVAMVLGLVLGVSSIRYALPLAAMALWMLVVAVSYTPLSSVLAMSITRTDTLQPSPAVAVLSSDIRPDGTPDAAMQQRLEQAFALLKENRAPRLVLTRLRTPDLSYVPWVRRSMRERGLTQTILETERIHNTHDEILALKRLLDRKGWKHVILVTDPLHSFRAVALAQKARLVILSSPGRYGAMDHENPIAVSERLGLFRIYLHERWMYHVNLTRGWI